MRLPDPVSCGQCGKQTLHGAELCHHCQAPNRRAYEIGRFMVVAGALAFLWIVISRLVEQVPHH